MALATLRQRKRRGVDPSHVTIWVLGGFCLGVAFTNIFSFSIHALSRNLFRQFDHELYTLPYKLQSFQLSGLQEESTIVDPRMHAVFRDARQVAVTNDWPFQRPNQVRILVVHVGKAGGASINEELRILMQAPKFLSCRMKRYRTKIDFLMDKCRQTRPGANKVAKITYQTYSDWHLARPESPKEREFLLAHTNLHLFTIRDPVSRLVSAFNYHRWQVLQRGVEEKQWTFDKDTMNFFQCFNNSQDLAQALDPRHDRAGISDFFDEAATGNPYDCHHLGLGVVQGTLAVDALKRFEYNYRYYLESTKTTRKEDGPDRRFLPNKRVKNLKGQVRIAVIRTENLWGDVARFEAMLGGSPDQFLEMERQNYRVSHGSEEYAVTSSVDDEGATALCCVIWDELQAYQDLTVVAVNLQEAEKAETLRVLHKRCGNSHESKQSSLQELSAWEWEDWAESSVCQPTRSV